MRFFFISFNRKISVNKKSHKRDKRNFIKCKRKFRCRQNIQYSFHRTNGSEREKMHPKINMKDFYPIKFYLLHIMHIAQAH